MLQKKNSNETSKTKPALDLTLSPALSLPQTLTHHFLNNTLKTKSRVLVVMNTKYARSPHLYVFVYWNRIHGFWTEVNLVGDCSLNL